MASRFLNSFRRPVAPALRANDDFYRQTFCRWIYNEDIQRARRVVRFNPDALASIAARAVKAQRCVSFEKIAEGSMNRIFQLRFDNGSEAIARILLPVGASTPLMTASEVATMDFARSVLNIPTPRVFAWSSGSTEVGTNFIICEKAPGTELDRVRPQAAHDARHPLFYVSEHINSISQKFLNNPFRSYGSIFYKKDVEGLPHEPLRLGDGQDRASEKFAIGLAMDWDLWRDERVTMKIDRGPWKDPAGYITASIRCQQEWLRRYATPRLVGDQFIRSDEDNSPAAHIELLEKLLSVLYALIPDAETCTPTLWHPDLQKGNIFISPTPPHEILSLIDWHTATIVPRYLQASFPEAMFYPGGRFDVDNIALPEGFEELNAEEQAILQKHQWEAVAQKHHTELIKQDPRHVMGVGHPYAPFIIEPICYVPRTWEEGIHGLKRSLTLIQVCWDILDNGGLPCPLTFSPEEIAHTAEVAERWESYDWRVISLFRELEVGADGRVNDVEKFELVKKKNDELRAKWDVGAAGGPYPFQDGAWPLMMWNFD